MLKWKDVSGQQLDYGDIVEDFERRYIGIIVHSYFNNQPVLHLISQFSYKTMTYVSVPNHGTNESMERSFIPRHNKLYWILHDYRLSNIELLKKGTNNEY